MGNARYLNCLLVPPALCGVCKVTGCLWLRNKLLEPLVGILLIFVPLLFPVLLWLYLIITWQGFHKDQ